jgi:hypothetical protein
MTGDVKNIPESLDLWDCEGAKCGILMNQRLIFEGLISGWTSIHAVHGQAYFLYAKQNCGEKIH